MRSNQGRQSPSIWEGLWNRLQVAGDKCKGQGKCSPALLRLKRGIDHSCSATAHRQSSLPRLEAGLLQDRKSTRLNSSHRTISYAVFCLKKKYIIYIILV